MTGINELTFYGSALTDIIVYSDNNDYASIDGIVYNKDTSTLICCPPARKSVSIPNHVTAINDRAFWYCKALTSATMPNTMTTIGKFTFFGCTTLTSITIPNSVTTICDYVFMQCYALETIENQSEISQTS